MPEWLDGEAIEIVREEAQTPDFSAVSAATAYHEAVEAMRWARQLLASGRAEPAEIAIASATPADYGRPPPWPCVPTPVSTCTFVHGVKVTASREGQAAAALADILLLRDLSQHPDAAAEHAAARLPRPVRGPARGLDALAAGRCPAFLPGGMEPPARQADRLPTGRTGSDHGPALAAIIGLLSRGFEAAEEAGETLLRGQVRAIWRKALAAGPAASLDLTLETLKLDDGLDACVSVCWMPASALAASPRRFVRLLGLNSARWPRSMAEDPPPLRPHRAHGRARTRLSVAAADRRDFATILATTESEIVLSRARRDEEGRLLGRSTLLPPGAGRRGPTSRATACPCTLSARATG